MTDRIIAVEPGKWIKVQHRTTGTPTKQETVNIGPNDRIIIARAGRRVMPGEDISSLSGERTLSLAPGDHKPFILQDSVVDITFEAGARIVGGGAFRGIEIIRGAPVLRNLDVSDCATGVRVFGDSDALIMGGQVHHNVHMNRNDTISGNDYGAMGVAFDDVVGQVTVRGVKVYGNRVSAAKPSIDYGLNEGSAFEMWRSSGVTIEDCELWDNQVAVETGTNGVQCSFIFRRNLVRNAKTDSARLSKGLLLRSAVNSLIEHNVFDRMDHWAMSVTGGGSFGGSVQGLVIRDNLAITPSALIQVGSPSGTWTHDYNAVAGGMAWGTGGSEPHGVAAADPKLGPDYLPLSDSPLIGRAHDGSDIGLVR